VSPRTQRYASLPSCRLFANRELLSPRQRCAPLPCLAPWRGGNEGPRPASALLMPPVRRLGPAPRACAKEECGPDSLDRIRVFDSRVRTSNTFHAFRAARRRDIDVAATTQQPMLRGSRLLQFLGFGAIGFWGFFVDLFPSVFGRDVLNLGHYTSAIFSFPFAVTFTSAGNRLFTFRGKVAGNVGCSGFAWCTLARIAASTRGRDIPAASCSNRGTFCGADDFGACSLRRSCMGPSRRNSCRDVFQLFCRA
jgi:hypothetical protein